MVKQIVIVNWPVLKKQFGLIDTASGALSARQISVEMRKQIEGKEPPPVALIDYEHKNFDSGLCLFNLVSYFDGVAKYCYTGTAK